MSRVIEAFKGVTFGRQSKDAHQRTGFVASQPEKQTRSKTNLSSGHNDITRGGSCELNQPIRHMSKVDAGFRRGNPHLDNELKKEMNRNQRQRGHIRKLNDIIQEWKECHKELDSDYNELEKQYQRNLTLAVVPYARSRGIQFNINNGKHVEEMHRRLLQDALRPQAPVAPKKIQQHGPEMSEAEMKALIKRYHASQNEMQVLHDRIAIAEDQKQDLHLKVQDLQAELLARADKTEAIPDDQLGQEFRTLVSMVRRLSREIPFDQSVDVPNILTSPGPLQEVSPHVWQGRAQKKRFIEAWTWAVLHQFVFETPFSIFGDVGKQLNEAWEAVFLKKHQLNWPSPSSTSETWRCTTFKNMLDSVNENATVYQNTENETNSFSDSVQEHRNQVQNIIETYLHSINPIADTTQVGSIIDRTFQLAMQMSLQRSRLRLTYPKVGALFVMTEMSVMPDQEDEDVDEMVVTYVANPGLTKWGDARGENYEHRFDIVPALVQLEP